MRIIITGIQYPAGEPEGITTVQEVEAEFFCREDSYYLLYEEHPEGYPKPLKTRVKLKGGTLEIHRQGPGGSTMFFEGGKTYRTEYTTPYGVLLLDIVTSYVKTEKASSAGWPDVKIEYTLQNEGEDMARYHLSIESK